MVNTKKLFYIMAVYLTEKTDKKCKYQQIKSTRILLQLC